MRRSVHAHARIALAVCLVGAASPVAEHDAQAAGLFVTDRGVRPLGRGGAYVAGADDLHSLWYNPAGLAEAGTGVLADFSWLNFSSTFQRRTQVTDAAGTVRTYDYPRVSGTTPFLPLPTIAGSYNLPKQKEITIGFGILAPYTAIASYPLTVGTDPAPSRYSLISLDGSALVMAGGYIAYKPNDKIQIGAGLQMLAGKFASRVVFSASPADRLIAAPEDPQYDTLSQLTVGPILAPSGNLGVIATPERHVRIGLSGQLPFWIDAPATVNVRLPTAAPFDRASQRGEDARVKFRMPPILRAGVELRPDMKDGSRFRIEGTYVREFWSLHDSIDVIPENVQLLNVTGFPSPFGVAPISLPRNFQDSNSFRVGGEYSIKDLIRDYWTDLRAGLQYETSAIPRAWVSPLTYDAAKVTASVGGGLHIGQHWRMDGMAALVFLQGTNVDPAEARVPRVNPVKGNPTATESINGGRYTARALVLGVGAQYRF